jgi:hypothetical protein
MSEALYTRPFPLGVPVTGQPGLRERANRVSGRANRPQGSLGYLVIVSAGIRIPRALCRNGSLSTSGGAAGPDALSVYARFTARAASTSIRTDERRRAAPANARTARQ